MKIAIIGAGISGLYLGWKLAKKGHDVTIFEKNTAIGNKVCSGLFSERILDFVPKSKNLVENEINSVLISFPKKQVKVIFSKRFLIMDHSKLDILLADIARSVGAKIILNHKVSEIPEGFDRIIGCDGAESHIRKTLKGKEPNLRLGIQGFVSPHTITRESFVDDKTNQGSDSSFGVGVKDNIVEAWPCKNGFLWKISRKNSTEYGVITDLDKAHRAFSNFIKENNIPIKEVKAKIISQGLIIPKNNKITLCGDAAGITKPWSGGGVIWGFRAADILLENFPDFKKYRRKANCFFIKKILISKIAIKIVYFLGFNIPWLLPKNNKIESDFLF
ncbi:NAD(P)-binding protein [Patescibacteria group bacterium]|nr:NAD(P)-binding protein [Patescibacteria group bacterium]